MREDVFKLCLAEIERHVERLFENGRLKAVAAGKIYARVPYLEDLFPVEYKSSLFQRQVCRALAAREGFRQLAPAWASDLPLSSTDIEKLICSKNPAMSLVGYF